MNNINKVILSSLAFIVITLTSTISFSKEKVTVKKSVSEMKCYVSLLGGGEIIHFVNSNRAGTAELANLLEGTSIFTLLSKQKKEVYKVKECVPLHDKFKNSIAKQLDENTVR